MNSHISFINGLSIGATLVVAPKGLDMALMSKPLVIEGSCHKHIVVRIVGTHWTSQSFKWILNHPFLMPTWQCGVGPTFIYLHDFHFLDTLRCHIASKIRIFSSFSLLSLCVPFMLSKCNWLAFVIHCHKTFDNHQQCQHSLHHLATIILLWPLVLTNSREVWRPRAGLIIRSDCCCRSAINASKIAIDTRSWS